MCGIGGIYHRKGAKVPWMKEDLEVMNQLQAHRGPDGEGVWVHHQAHVGLAHRRLNIIDLTGGAQPMASPFGAVIVFNGEIYNYLELREELGDYPFSTHSDTEVILAAYHRWGKECVHRLRGMFAFAIWDERAQELFLARDRFGIKPLVYTRVGDLFYFASEVKALIPFLPEVETDTKALKEYLAFQFCLGNKTLFAGVEELAPAHWLSLSREGQEVKKYWEVYYELDFNHTAKYFEERLRHMVIESVSLHTRADVPLGTYVSGGVDSGVIASLAAKEVGPEQLLGFNGKFTYGRGYDESAYAQALGKKAGMEVKELAITSQDFVDSIDQIIYHLDYPIAGPGAFPQFAVARFASQFRKVMLGGQGGDEIFGGYTRYLIAYFEQCVKAAIDGTSHSGNFVVTYESIIPNLRALKNYKPLLKDFWSQGLFEDLDRRYFWLINRARDLKDEIRWEALGDYDPFQAFVEVFHGKNVKKESYFDSMTHFDFKTLLRALLHVEDRMSMAHGLESRVPLVDHRVVEFAATIPSDVKFKDGTLKRVFLRALGRELPSAILKRKDKMGFPVPLNEWLQGELRDLVQERFQKDRPYFDRKAVVDAVARESKFGRKIWGLLCLELWHQRFHDRAAEFRALRKQEQGVRVS